MDQSPFMNKCILLQCIGLDDWEKVNKCFQVFNLVTVRIIYTFLNSHVINSTSTMYFEYNSTLFFNFSIVALPSLTFYVTNSNKY